MHAQPFLESLQSGIVGCKDVRAQSGHACKATIDVELAAVLDDRRLLLSHRKETNDVQSLTEGVGSIPSEPGVFFFGLALGASI